MASAMGDGPKAFFEGDHRRCDALWSQVEGAVDAGADEGAAWRAFADAMERHFQMEEEVLFPRLEERTGMPPGAGPTAVMRAEHAQMRGGPEKTKADSRVRRKTNRSKHVQELASSRSRTVVPPVAAYRRWRIRTQSCWSGGLGNAMRASSLATWMSSMA